MHRSQEELDHFYDRLKYHKDPPPGGGGERLKILSWNILADAFVSQQYFPYVNSDYLLYSYRIELIKSYILNKNCDVMCLQEVDSSGGFFAFLMAAGYDYQFRPRGKQGILIAYKKHLFALVDCRFIDFDSLISQHVDKSHYNKGHGSVMLKLQTKTHKRIIIANTHLHWDPQYEKVKYHQICSAMSQIFAFRQYGDYVIFAGDLNSLPDSNVARFVQFNEFPIQELCTKPDANYEDMKAKFIETKNYCMQLATAFTDDDGSYTNYTRDFKGKIDYIFYDYTCLQVAEKQRLPEESELAQEVALPNSKHPSDHIPLICTFVLGEHST